MNLSKEQLAEEFIEEFENLFKKRYKDCFLAGFDAAEERAAVLVSALEYYSTYESEDPHYTENEPAKLALAKYRGTP